MTRATLPALSAQGLDDASFVTILRDDMDDPPLPNVETFPSQSVVPFIRLNKIPAYDADDFLTVINTGTGKSLTPVSSRLAITGDTQFYLEPETGYVYFNSLAATSPIQVAHYTVRWTNRRMLNALYAGLKAMFPRVWQRKNPYVFQVAVNQWEYSLPNDFLDPRTSIYRVEWQEIPSGTERYHRGNSWFPVGLNSIHIPWSQSISPGANVRVSYAAPYQSLSELEPQLQHLPLWYAKGKLLMDKEVLRSRYDMGPVSQNEQQYPPGTSQNAGIYHMQQFERELDRLQRPMPAPAIRSVYSR